MHVIHLGMLKKDFFRRTIDDIYKELTYLIFYFQGEPYLNTEFLDMVKYATGKGIYTATSTNAHYLTDEKAKKTVESGLDRLIISIDGTTQDVYKQYRVGGGGSINSFTGCILHHIQKLCIQIGLSLKVKDEVSEFFINIVDSAAEEVLFKHARGTGECT